LREFKKGEEAFNATLHLKDRPSLKVDARGILPREIKKKKKMTINIHPEGRKPQSRLNPEKKPVTTFCEGKQTTLTHGWCKKLHLTLSQKGRRGRVKEKGKRKTPTGGEKGLSRGGYWKTEGGYRGKKSRTGRGNTRTSDPLPEKPSPHTADEQKQIIKEGQEGGT